MQVAGGDADVQVVGGVEDLGQRAAATGKGVADERVPAVVDCERGVVTAASHH